MGVRLPSGARQRLLGGSVLALAIAAAPPPVGDIVFGAATRAGAGGYAGVTSFTPDSGGHFELFNGAIVPTATGVASGLNGAPYNVTVDGQARTITVEASVLDILSVAELGAALTHCGATPGTGWSIKLREGVFLDGASSTQNIGTVTSLFEDRRVVMEGITMSGTVTDPNAAQVPATWAGDANATATCPGGSVTITCRTANAAGFDGQAHVYNCKGIIFDGLDFRYETYTDQFFRAENNVDGYSGPTEASTNQADASGGIVVFDGIDGNSAAQSEVIVRGSRIGGGLNQAGWDAGTSSSLRYVHGAYVQRAQTFVMEDCELLGTYQIGKIARTKRTVIRRNFFRGQCDRGLVCFVNDEAGYNPVYQVYGNVLTDVIRQADWRASHFDWWQFGVGGAEVAAFFDVYGADNHIDMSTIVIFAANPQTRDTHGHVGTGNVPLIRGVIERTLMIQAGIEASSWVNVASTQTGGAQGLIIRDCTFLKQFRFETPASAVGNPASPVRVNGNGDIACIDCLAGTFFGGFGSFTGNVGARHDLTASRADNESGSGVTVYPYNQVLTGAFTHNGTWWEADDIANYDTSTMAGVIAWLDANCKSQGPAAGIGY